MSGPHARPQTPHSHNTPRWPRWAAAVLSGGLIGVAAAMHLPALDNAWLEWLRYLPYPLYLLLAAVALAISVRLKAGWRWLALAALLAVAWPVMGGVWGHPDEGTVALRVMTYNIKAYLADGSPGGFGRIAAEIAEHDPDVLLLQDAQEIVGPAHGNLPPLRALLGGRHVFAEGELVIASRHALHHCRSLPMPGPLHHRSAIACRVQAGGTEAELVTAHLLSPRQGLNATRHAWWGGFDDWQDNYRHRLLQARALAARLASPGVPLILGGDLNAPEHSPVLRTLLAAGMRDAFTSAGVGYGYTVGHALRPGVSLLRLDHLLVSADIGVAQCFAGSAAASEHRPVVADLWLRRH